MPSIILAAYGVVILAVCFLLIFPDLREKLTRKFLNILNKSFLAFKSVFSVIRGNTLAVSTGLASRSAFSVNTILIYRRWLIAALLIIAMPILVILLFQHRVDVGSYSNNESRQDAVITALLDGERLVPPPALPPEIFATREVLAERPALVDASRDWGLLDVAFQQALLKVFLRMREQGYEMALIEGYRSPDRQNRLAAMGGNVTNAKAFQSYHQYGLAADCAFLRNGRLVISERDTWAMRGYELYGREAEAAGLTWGGRWKFMDFGHVELRRAGARQGN
ncbi:MAG: D-alanyl-D-alanine carboxypeptidase [Rhodocyclales bacterium]|nr:D-alanyl-D-alanine carboxypeptidase [Rhodocyclales bacterium]